MIDSTDPVDAGMPRYRSSAAARMVNIPVATLRVWERRYNVVGPTQAPSGHRLYSSQDVRRLVLIKQLVNKGHAIGMLARVETPRLQDLVNEAEQTESVLARGIPLPAGAPARASSASGSPVVRLLLVGTGASARWGDALRGIEGLQVVGSVDDSAVSELALQQVQADMVLADLGAVHMESVDWLSRMVRTVGARQMIVIYGFANTQVQEALRARAAVLRRSPLAPDEFRQTVLETVRGWRSVSQALLSLPDPAPAPRFDTSDLVALTAAMPKVACECPKHMAELITMLGQFEAYSADCESRQPADVALHAYLYRVAGHARALMEEALATVAQAEGVTVPGRKVAA
ncbi:MerR-like DNA binding protein [Aquabacterium commune]|uniref:MerR-like DNA binding protein n=1 Tax=Aquabacterium commune TaxID=70586 RepID=A0A4R6RHA2_9BURK|nr:MerR-like DNA binding protein [Aquabacterium commune]